MAVIVVSYRNSTSNHNGGSRYSDWLEVVSYRNSTSNHNCTADSYLAYWVVSYRNSTSNHNRDDAKGLAEPLYLIEILHQTTTRLSSLLPFCCCILSKFYIKPQLNGLSLYAYWVVSYRNSTSNHNSRAAGTVAAGVVSYRNSTSNHNFESLHLDALSVVSYRNSTSNHNRVRRVAYSSKLYLIEILHQTTTFGSSRSIWFALYLIEILHQTTTKQIMRFSASSLYLIEILHQTTTALRFMLIGFRLYLIEILHQTTTSGLILIDKVLLTGCLPL